VIDLGALSQTLPRRTERLAYIRNAALEEVRRNGWDKLDHLVVADLDDVLALPVKAEEFALASRWLNGAQERAAVLANAIPRYYDLWALRHDQWCPYDCWHSIWGRAPGMSFEAAKFREVFVRQIEIPAHLPPIEVRSAFGGLAIYRTPFALKARYRGIDAQQREVSEHVAFNDQITSCGGKLYVFPALQVHAPRQHLYHSSEMSPRWRVRMLGQRLYEFFSPPWRNLVDSKV
jgi:hypothetical protein